MSFIKRLIFSALLAPLPGGAAVHAAEFEVMDRFSVDGYSVLKGSADIPGGSFAVGGSTLAVQYGKVGIGTAAPGGRLEIVGSGSVVPLIVSTGTAAASEVLRVNSSGNVGIGTTNPAANLDVAGGIKMGNVAACTEDKAGTMRWSGLHFEGCTGAAWRQFDNQPPPTITGISPASGIISGGTAITINGTGFNQGLEILIDGVAASAITFVSAAQMTATTPARTAGSKDVKLTNPDGQYCAWTFTYNPFPTITGISPASGPQGTVITIAGTGFQAGAGVKIGADAATVTGVTSTQLTATTPASTTSGARNVTVTNPDTGSVAQTGGFAYSIYAEGGAIVGSYRVHTFNSGGAITFLTGGNIEALVIAGGGSGGATPSGGYYEVGGGGGGGGVLYNTSFAVTAGQEILVTVGEGGLGTTGNIGSSGGDSKFGTLTAVGGGAGGGYYHGPAAGGSGGGGQAWDCAGSRCTGGAGTSSQGKAGGNGSGASPAHDGAGGGGGAGTAGGNASGANGGNGGDGLSNSISGAAVYYGGGGGGAKSPNEGTYGLGGAGGGGASANPGNSGAAHTGGGGGAGQNGQAASTGGNGGSGLVIVRYLK